MISTQTISLPQQMHLEVVQDLQLSTSTAQLSLYKPVALPRCPTDIGGVSMGATDFFLPLDRVQRALKCLQEDKPITRGTIQTSWSLRPFDECKRLGLTPKNEKQMRELFPDAIGLLVAETILPKGIISFSQK